MEEIKKIIRSILMTENLAQKTFDGLKTQTRRVITNQPTFAVRYDGADLEDPNFHWWEKLDAKGEPTEDYRLLGRCRYGKVGDVVYIRENYFAYGFWEITGINKNKKQTYRFRDLTGKPSFEYKFPNDPPPRIQTGRTGVIGWYKRPAIYMPAAAARSWVEILEITVERVQKISETDAKAEGVEPVKWNGDDGRLIDYRTAYSGLWDEINEERGFEWNLNPWVFVITYRKTEKI